MSSIVQIVKNKDAFKVAVAQQRLVNIERENRGRCRRGVSVTLVESEVSYAVRVSTGCDILHRFFHH